MSASRPGRFFTWDEFARSATASKLGISNAPTPEHRKAIEALCEHVLDPLRLAIGVPIEVTSGYRSEALNAAIKGSKSSQHMKGEAADIKARGMTAEQLATAIVKAGLPFDQCIWYAPTNGGQVHVSYTTTRANRGQTLHSPTKNSYQAWRPQP